MKLLVLKITLCLCLIGAILFFCFAIYNCQKIETYKELKQKEPTDQSATP